MINATFKQKKITLHELPKILIYDLRKICQAEHPSQIL